ncbi:MAG TPA: GDSL-type esterase/lipase family protein, partial [Chthoniobacterales bacterium]
AVTAAIAFGLGVLSRPVLSKLAGRLASHASSGARNEVAPFDPLRFARKASQFAELPASNKTIEFLGDSRIEDGNWSELLDSCHVSNRGIGGDTTSGIVERLASTGGAEGGWCVIQAGINDLSQGGTIETVADNYRRIIDHLVQSARMRVLVTSVILVGNEHAALNAKIAACNRALAEVAAARGSVWLDVNQALCPRGFLSPEYSNDGVHLNGKAYLQLRDLLAPILTAEQT